MPEVILIGERDPERQRLAALADDIASALIHVLSDISTDDLVAVADYRESVHPQGWMQKMIREYVEIWR